jgi:hypothetical protein
MVQVHPGPLRKSPRQRGFLLVRGARGTVRIELLVNVGQPPPWTETQMAKRKTVPEGRQRVVVETGIYRKSTGKYLAQYRDPGRKQHWKEFTTLDAARKWRARAIQDPTSISAGKRFLSEVWSTYLEHHGESLKRTTRANWEQEWRAHIEPALGQLANREDLGTGRQGLHGRPGEARHRRLDEAEVPEHPSSHPAGGC